jgi:hypothetical protein
MTMKTATAEDEGLPIVFLDIDDVLCLNNPYGGSDALEAVKGRHADPDTVLREIFAAEPKRVLESVHKEMARAARDGSVPRPAAVCVMSPWIDLALTSDSIGARAKHDPLLTRDALEDARRLYLGQANAKDPRASPLYGDLTDLPPVLLHVGADEILLDDARRYAHLLANSGPAAELHVWEGMVHVFPANLVLLQAAREALDLAGEFLRRKRSLAE